MTLKSSVLRTRLLLVLVTVLAVSFLAVVFVMPRVANAHHDAYADDHSVQCSTRQVRREARSGSVYRTMEITAHHETTSSVRADSLLVGWQIFAHNCPINGTNVLSDAGSRADAAWLGRAAMDGSGYRDTSSVRPCSSTSTFPSPNYPGVVGCPPGGASGNFTAYQDDSNAIVLNGHLLVCRGHGDIYGTGVCGPSVYQRGAGTWNSNPSIPTTSNAYHGAGFVTTGAGQDISNIFGRDGSGGLQNSNISISSRNTWPGGYGVRLYLTLRYPVTPPLPPTCTISTTPGGPFEVGQRFTARVTTSNYSGTLSYSWPAGLSSDPRPTGSSGGNITNVRATTPGTHLIRVNLSGGASCTRSITTGTKPYLKAFGGEVMTGGSFAYSNGGSCTPPPGRGGIYAWSATDSSGRHIGSSAQLTVSSLLTINQFYSASQRTSATNSLPPKGLTFANTAANASDSGNSTYGGGSGNALCITDYFNETRDPSLEVNHLEWMNSGTRGRFQDNALLYEGDSGFFCLPGIMMPDGSTHWFDVDCDLEWHNYQANKNSSGTLISSLSSLTIPPGVQVAMYVDGDITITGDITYNTSGVTSWDDHPYFVLIARGNIYIGPDVTRLNGLYVAQPKESGNGGGTIYTCAAGPTQTYSVSNIYNNCQNQLTINGGLVAHDVRFLRFHGSLEQATPNEVPNFLTGQGTKAAEVINYTPEMYLAPSPLKQPNSSSTETNNPRSMGAYDSIRSLPPIY